MKKRLIALTILFILFLTATALAQTSIKAQVDKTSITTDETLTYKLIITSSDKKIPTPQIPKFEGFNVISQAQSTTVSHVKTKIKTIIVYEFILFPIDTGKFKIEPSIIKIKSKTYSTSAFEIEVTEGKTKPKPKPEQKPSLPKGIPSEEPEQPKITL